MPKRTVPILRSRLLAEGYRASEIRRLCTSRELEPVRRGAYVGRDDPALRRPEDRHHASVRAAVEQLDDLVVSHVSAALHLGIAV